MRPIPYEQQTASGRRMTMRFTPEGMWRFDFYSSTGARVGMIRWLPGADAAEMTLDGDAGDPSYDGSAVYGDMIWWTNQIPQWWRERLEHGEEE